MGLLQLPPEILVYILDYLGSEFFRQNVSRLTISKQWYDTAWTVFVRDLSFSARSLRRFADSEQVLLRMVQPYTNAAKLHLEGCDLYQYLLSEGDVAEWNAKLNSAIAKLATVLRQCDGLRSLTLKAGPERPELNLERYGYLTVKPLVKLLSMRHLTSLHFDTAGSYPSRRGSDTSIHLCRSINALLPSLRSLRCRMDSMCDSLLELPSGNSSLCLQEVIINLSLSELSDEITSYRLPNYCQPGPSRTFTKLKETLESQAVCLTSRLSDPRMIRIIWHKLPSCDIYASDALSGKRVRLESNTDWSADGQVEEEEEEDHHDENDLFDSDSSDPPEITF